MKLSTCLGQCYPPTALAHKYDTHVKLQFLKMPGNSRVADSEFMARSPDASGSTNSLEGSQRRKRRKSSPRGAFPVLMIDKRSHRSVNGLAPHLVRSALPPRR